VTFVSGRTKPVGLHLAVLAEPFLSFVLNGRKTIESRFTRTRCAPFDQIRQGDIILLKQVGGPVCGLVLAKQTWFFDLHHLPIETIREQYGESICADDAFWALKRDAAYATLIELAEPVSIDAIPCKKRDRRGWVALTPPQMSLAF
jgi:ASC-1-like (ASCH) protein